MKKEDAAGFIVYFVILAFALVFGLTYLRTVSPNLDMNTGVYIAYVLGAIVAGVVFNAIIFELAHVLGAKIGGYQILSVCILGLTFKKVENKWKVCFGSFDGLTGETKIIPKQDAKKTPNPRPYLLLGTLFFALELAVVVGCYMNHARDNIRLFRIAFFLLVLGVVGGMIWFYNIVPVKLDSINDGYRLRLISNVKNLEAFNELLRVEHEVELGHTDVDIKTFTTITKFTMDLNLNKVYVLLDNKDYKAAEELLDLILQNGNELSRKLYLRAQAQKIYINIVTKPLSEAKEYYDKQVSMDVRRELSNDVSMPSIRTYILMAGLLDKSKSETFIALNNVYKAFKNTPTNRKTTEAVLFNNALEMVCNAHKDWELEDYKIDYNPNKKK